MLAVVVAVAGYGAYEAQCEEMQLSETMLANVEALADDESSIPSGTRPAFFGVKHYTGALKWTKDSNGKCLMTFLTNYTRDGECNL